MYVLFQAGSVVRPQQLVSIAGGGRQLTTTLPVGSMPVGSVPVDSLPICTLPRVSGDLQISTFPVGTVSVGAHQCKKTRKLYNPTPLDQQVDFEPVLLVI